MQFPCAFSITFERTAREAKSIAATPANEKKVLETKATLKSAFHGKCRPGRISHAAS
jgi:hypothetical protein